MLCPLGFGESEGGSDFVIQTFCRYLEIHDINPSKLQVKDQVVNDFVDFLSAQESGRLCQSEEGLSSRSSKVT